MYKVDVSSLVFCVLLRHRQSRDELALRSACEGSPGQPQPETATLSVYGLCLSENRILILLSCTAAQH